MSYSLSLLIVQNVIIYEETTYFSSLAILNGYVKPEFPSLQVGLKFQAHIRSDYRRYWKETSLVKNQTLLYLHIQEKVQFSELKILGQEKKQYENITSQNLHTTFITLRRLFDSQFCCMRQWPLNNQNKVSHCSESTVLRFACYFKLTVLKLWSTKG